MINLFGPNSANGTSTRPPSDTKTTVVDLWFKDATSANSFDGTVVDASWYNTITAQLRNIVVTSGVLPAATGQDDLSDDTLLARAIQEIAAAGNPNLVSNTTFVSTINRYATTAWVTAQLANFQPSNSGPTLTTQHFSPGAGVASLTISSGYTPGNVLVFRNGVLLENGVDYAATASPNIVLTNASVAGESFDVYLFSSFTVANAVQKSGDTMAGPLALAAGSSVPTSAAGDSSLNIANTSWVMGQFPASMGTSGYQKLASGLIIQWGQTATIAANTALSVTLPMTFPNAGYMAVATATGVGTGTLNACGAQVATTSQISVTNTNSFSIPGANWIAIGH